MPRLEASIEDNCCKIAKDKYNLSNIKVVVPGEKGWPDRLFWARTTEIIMFFVEFKRKGETSSKLQREIHKQIRESGIDVYVLDNEEDFEWTCHCEIHT